MQIHDEEILLRRIFAVMPLKTFWDLQQEDRILPQNVLKNIEGEEREERKKTTKQARETPLCALSSHFSLLTLTFHEEEDWESHQTLPQRNKEGANILVKWGAGKLQAPSRWHSSSCWSPSGHSPAACCGSPEISPQTSSCWCTAGPWWTPLRSPRSHLLTKHTENCNLKGI